MRFSIPFILGLAAFTATVYGANLTSFRATDDLLFDILLAIDALAFRVESSFRVHENLALLIGAVLLVLPSVAVFHLGRVFCGGSTQTLRDEGRAASTAPRKHIDTLLERDAAAPVPDEETPERMNWRRGRLRTPPPEEASARKAAAPASGATVSGQAAPTSGSSPTPSATSASPAEPTRNLQDRLGAAAAAVRGTSQRSASPAAQPAPTTSAVPTGDLESLATTDVPTTPQSSATAATAGVGTNATGEKADSLRRRWATVLERRPNLGAFKQRASGIRATLRRSGKEGAGDA